MLKGVTLDVERHEVVCLIGASGSGTFTLLRCVNALEDISSGEIPGRLVIVTGADPVGPCRGPWSVVSVGVEAASGSPRLCSSDGLSVRGR